MRKLEDPVRYLISSLLPQLLLLYDSIIDNKLGSETVSRHSETVKM